MNFDNDFNEVLVAFAKSNVAFMIVGGAAVNFYGFDRTTSDLDLWVKPTSENMKRIHKAFCLIGFTEEDASFILAEDFLNEPKCVKLGEEPHTMDVMTHMVGLKYEEADELKIPFQAVNEYTVYFIHYTHLVVNKMLAGRPKDKIDVDALQRIIQLRKENKP